MRSEKLAEENGGGGVVGGGGEEGGWQNSFPNTRTRRSPLCHLCWILTRAFTEQPTPVSHGTANVTCHTRVVVQKLLHVSFILWHWCICTMILRGQTSTPVSGYRGYQTSLNQFFLPEIFQKNTQNSGWWQFTLWMLGPLHNCST